MDAISYFECVYESMIRPPDPKSISVKENVTCVETNWVPTNEAHRLPCGLFHANVPFKAAKQPVAYPNGEFVFILIFLLPCVQNIFSHVLLIDWLNVMP